MWPTSQIAPTSAAGVRNQLCSQAAQLKQSAAALRVRAAASQLTPADLKSFVPQVRGARAFLNANDGDGNVQAYARLVSDPAFVLLTESATLKAAYASLVQEGRALFQSAQASMAADGSVTEPLATFPAASCTAFIAACTALESAVA